MPPIGEIRYSPSWVWVPMSQLGFSPNYDMTWSQIFHKLVRSLLIGDEHSALSHLETWDDHEIAVMRTNILILGRVIEAESTRETNGVQLGMIKWRSEQDTYTLGDRLSNYAAKSIRKNDLVYMFPAARLPSIVRPVYDGAGLPYLFIIAVTMNLAEWGNGTDNPVPTWCDTSASITDSLSAWVGSRAVWDWGVSREQMTYESSIPSERTQLHLELMADSGLIWAAPETLQDRISTLEDFGEVLTRAESHQAASEVFSTLINLYLSVTGCNSPEFVAITEKMRQLHQKTNNRHYKDNCLWKIEAITCAARGMKVTERTLTDLQAVKAPSIADPDEHRKFKDWCKYRAEDVRRSITPRVLGNIVNQPGRRTIGPLNWVLDCLGPDDVEVVGRFLADNSCYEGVFITPNRVDFQVALYLKWKMECIPGSIDPETLHKFKTLKAATEDVFHQASCLSLEQVEFVLVSLRDLIPAPEKQQLFTKAAHWGERNGARQQMELILDKWDGVVITEDVILEAVKVALLVGTKLEDLVLPLLVERSRDLHLFMRRCGEYHPIDARVLVELASKIRGPRLLSVFERLLSLFDIPKVRNNAFLRSVDVKRLIIAAAANKGYGKDLVKTVLRKYIGNTVIGPQALRRAWITNEHSKDAMFILLEERIGKPWVEKVEELCEKQWIRGDQYSEGVISLLIKYAMSKVAAG
ncbi:hypothetical protein QBC37DRAFT_455373 [Rhypophila decipiens]|uniref:Uncharacterized protein n=1 Tax=Rhypophila decipiens TaxID=261697 RepID=A0AAN7B457_9PEZI|nr:hypothetical protein QBC37DRAFT_455373 [Rhypophila decipiens]